MIKIRPFKSIFAREAGSVRAALVFILAAACVLGLMAAAGIGSETSGAAPALDAVSAATTRYLPVVFRTHDRHANERGLACAACHHETEKDAAPKSCSSCHNEPGAKVDLKTAMHKRCRGCHIAAREKNKDSKAPVDCLGCHTQRK